MKFSFMFFISLVAVEAWVNKVKDIIPDADLCKKNENHIPKKIDPDKRRPKSWRGNMKK